MAFSDMDLESRQGKRVVEEDGQPFLTNNIIEDSAYEYDRIPGPSEDQVVLIKNPRNRIGPKHVYTRESFPDSLCGKYNMGIGTSTLRVSSSLDECVEIVNVEDFDSEDDILCVNCSKNY